MAVKDLQDQVWNAWPWYLDARFKISKYPYRNIEIKLGGMSGIDNDQELGENLYGRTKSEYISSPWDRPLARLCLQILPHYALKSNSPWPGVFPLLSRFANTRSKMSLRAFLKWMHWPEGCLVERSLKFLVLPAQAAQVYCSPL